MVHAYDPCVAAERQAGNFVTIVPRDPMLLPPAIALERLLDFMPQYEVLWDECRRVAMQNVAGWSHVPVRVLR